MPEPRQSLLEAAETVYIGLGANLDDPRAHVTRAAAQLTGLPASRLEAVSPLYRTAPLGPAGQPDYINAAARLRTRLAPRDLLRTLQALEQAHGRVRDGRRWGPRTLDLDILLFGARRAQRAGLTLPHPEIHRRAFVLVPLAQVAPMELEIPGQGRLAALLAMVPQQGVAALGSIPLDFPAGALGVAPEPAGAAEQPARAALS